ncbi:MAG TPA: cytochrome c peroxidase [Acidocella sp.]|uniref:cytochrome-c peroxidase n=1 Tax=Acidocella sp. TaxID=50710 RepID=UPI002CF41B7A|nr:cytochrome c peroxidase [Acidocella sp.]HVE20523.1 cytochrome c peroxidase [Acidocella sp.]
MRILASLVLIVTLGVCAALGWVLQGPIPLADWFSNPVASFQLARGENPSPVQLVRPVPPAQFSIVAEVGRQIFFDTSLSGSGKLSCASCHDPANHYGPPTGSSIVYGGPDMHSPGVRAVPTLTYLSFQKNFYIGPDPAGDSDVMPALPQLAKAAQSAARTVKTAQSTAQSAANIVPAGGLFWDGRADTLQQQAMGPLTSPYEMDGGSAQTIAAKLQAAPYASTLKQLFGDGIFSDPSIAVSEALFAVARYQIEDRDFHAYTSKYDYWLEGKARLNPAEMRGYILFNDPAKGDCGACHLDQPTPDHRPPQLTDTQYEALGVPRNPDIPANQDPHYYDLGLCGPYRTDLQTQTQYCGMFLTPTLRNTATRKVFFHNGAYHTLRDVVEFYNLRDVDPGKIYPTGPDGKVKKFNDLPKKYWANIDNTDPPLNRRLGDKPALTDAEVSDLVAFLKTLTDGYKPGA